MGTKWNDALANTARDMYAGRANGELNDAVVARIVAAINTGENKFTNRQVISKLVNLGVYVKDPVAEKAPRDEGPTKKDILADLAATGFDVTGGENATKDFLNRVLDVARKAAA